MAFCKNCGAPMDDNVRFCANCGCSVDGAPAGGTSVVNASDKTAEFDAADIADTKFLSIFCYFGVMTMLLPLVIKPNSAFVRFHANQGLILILLGIALGVVCIIPILGWIVAGVGAIFELVCIILAIINCCQGKAKELPLLGKIRIFH